LSFCQGGVTPVATPPGFSPEPEADNRARLIIAPSQGEHAILASGGFEFDDLLANPARFGRSRRADDDQVPGIAKSARDILAEICRTGEFLAIPKNREQAFRDFAAAVCCLRQSLWDAVALE
jgi:hypothetical protein